MRLIMPRLATPNNSSMGIPQSLQGVGGGHYHTTPGVGLLPSYLFSGVQSRDFSPPKKPVRTITSHSARFASTIKRDLDTRSFRRETAVAAHRRHRPQAQPARNRLRFPRSLVRQAAPRSPPRSGPPAARKAHPRHRNHPNHFRRRQDRHLHRPCAGP